jgi:DNA gyrase subunit A
VAGALAVREADELMLITTKGKMVRTRVKQIRMTSRNTMGVKLIELKAGSKLQAIAPVISLDADPAEGEEDLPPPQE